MVPTFSSSFVEAFSDLGIGFAQEIEGGLRADGVEEGFDELAKGAPCAGARQAACAQCGESSSSSTNGSSKRMNSK